MGLFFNQKQKSIKKKKTVYEQMQKSKANSSGERLDKLTTKGELPFGWYAHNQEIVKPYNDKIVEYAKKIAGTSGKKRITALKELISYYYKTKKLFYSKGKCFQKYFQKTWEHCHNSRNKDFEYIKPYEEELLQLEKEFSTE